LEYLIIRAELSNVGHSRVMITPHKSAVDVYAHRLPPKVKVRIVMRPKWDDSSPIATLAFFDWPGGRKYLEPNSLMIDEVLVAIPGLSDRFLRIDGYVESGKVAWLSRTVVKPPAVPTKPMAPDDKAEVMQTGKNGEVRDVVRI
jgi:hypothetical protein